jgi:Rrf2 family protein
MKFSTKSTYGLRAIVRLAKEIDRQPVSLNTIAEEENISLGYLETIFSLLKKAKLVKAVKGAAGGYILLKKPDVLNAWQIIDALEGKNSLFHCLEEKEKVFCSKKCACNANFALLAIESSLNQTLKNISLASLVR